MESIVLPPISTGIFGYPIKEVVEICAIVIVVINQNI
ncbi:MAG: macro domain-containing protein [Bacilli bacterium]|nr:macro domain-containing protein [Bacilli bacterium]